MKRVPRIYYRMKIDFKLRPKKWLRNLLKRKFTLKILKSKRMKFYIKIKRKFLMKVNPQSIQTNQICLWK
jgi:hypothetical protein